MAIRPNLSQEYLDFLEEHPYLKQPIEIAFSILDEGKTPMQVEDSFYDFNLSSLETGIISGAITRFHTLGNQFRKYWNKRNNQPENKGLSDPEVLTYGDAIKKRKNPSV